MNRSTTFTLAILSLLGCLPVKGCFLGYNPPSYAHFKIELREIHVETTDSDLSWILATILEAQQYDCDYHAELHLKRQDAYFSHRCIGLDHNRMVTYRLDQDGIELRVTAQPSEIGEQVNNLTASFDAAHLRYFSIR